MKKSAWLAWAWVLGVALALLRLKVRAREGGRVPLVDIDLWRAVAQWLGETRLRGWAGTVSRHFTGAGHA